MNLFSPVGAVMVIFIAGLMWWSGKLNARWILEKRFPATTDPGGPYTECEIRFPTADVPTPCMVRVTPEGWYMFTPQEMRATWRWVNNVPFLRKPVFIPWASLECSEAKFPMRDWLRFDVKQTRAIFFVRKNVGLPLLEAAQRPLPALR
jgi:hypothetical protein